MPGCPSLHESGPAESEALENIREAIELCLEARRDEGLPLTIALYEVEVPMSPQAAAAQK